MEWRNPGQQPPTSRSAIGGNAGFWRWNGEIRASSPDISKCQHPLGRPIITPPDHRNRKPARPFNLKSKSFWAAPTAIIAITLHRFLDWQIPFPQSWLTNSIVAAIADQLNDPEPIAYITLAAAFSAYWFAKENCPAALKELTQMGIAAYFRQIKEEVIAEEVAKAIAEEVPKAEAIAEARGEAQGEARGVARGLSEGRQNAIDELRAMPTHEVLALLQRQDTPPAPNPEPPPNNGQPPLP